MGSMEFLSGRGTAALLALTTALLLLGASLPATALAQSGEASACQYDECTATGESAVDPTRFVDPAAKGTRALSDTLSGGSSSGDAALGGRGTGLKVLPETGGVPLPALAGLALLVCGGVLLLRANHRGAEARGRSGRAAAPR